MNSILAFGEILLRLSTPRALKISQTTLFEAGFGGAETNVAISLSNLGHKVGVVTRLPENKLTEAILLTLNKYKVDTQHILKGGNRVGLYYLETGAGIKAADVLYDRAGSSMAEIQPGMVDWNKIFEKASWFHWSGITPAISQSAADTCLEALEIADKKGLTISVDLNFREKLWKYGKRPLEILPSLLDYCDVIFGGIDAPEKIFGLVPEGKDSTKGKLSTEDILSISNQLLQMFPKATLFASTLRNIYHHSHHSLKGMIYDKYNLYLSKEYDMPDMQDRMGGGDAFMAGLIHGTLNYNTDYQYIVDFATSASVLKHYTHGDFNLASEEEVKKYIGGTTSTINR